MKIFLVCSKHFYYKVPEYKPKLEAMGHIITLPNSYDSPLMEEEKKKESKMAHIEWKAKMIRMQEENVNKNDALLVLNFEKNGQKNYIGGATFLEIAKAFELNKKIFLLNPIPESIFEDELTAMNPTIINGDLSLLK